jgi:NAD(P)-dependent dehydrogenase (short-subunit alcohol dehydrogenase family)
MQATRSVALVTGGSRGIGRAIVEALLAEGWAVEYCGRNGESVQAAAKELAGAGERVRGTVVDVRDGAAVRTWVQEAHGRRGQVDALVNNAGLGGFGAVDEIGETTFRAVVETNLFGCFHTMAAVAPLMRQRGAGWIVNVGSLAGRNAFAGGAAYNASKFGLVGLSEAAMLDLRHAGVRVATILPGSVDTELRQGMGGDAERPDRCWMLQPADVARAVLDLLRFPDRALPSLVELRPSRPPRR